eukprot:37238_1
MGCLCCCCRSNKSDEDYKSLEPDDESSKTLTDDQTRIQNYNSTSTVDESAMQQQNNEHLLNMEHDALWNAKKTEQLEHELEKEILVRRYTDNTDKTNPTSALDDILSHSLSEPEKERRHSNLFRYQSKRSWDDADLSDQEAALKQQLAFLAKQEQTEQT